MLGKSVRILKDVAAVAVQSQSKVIDHERHTRLRRQLNRRTVVKMVVLLDWNEVALAANAELVIALCAEVVARSTLELLGQLINAAVLGR